MAKLKGTVGKSDLEGGFWTFETEAGDVYKLEGAAAQLKELLKEGAAAEVDGTVDDEAMGIGFGAPVLKVKSFKLR